MDQLDACIAQGQRLRASHDALLAALRWFINDIDGTHTVMLEFDAAVTRARAAIAAAEKV